MISLCMQVTMKATKARYSYVPMPMSIRMPGQLKQHTVLAVASELKVTT